ncbi:MAG: phosphatidylglycerophosphatase A [Pseudoalteromonas spongiae]|uniref:Phosphatidylglycerophosphatase A n=1 Tax=Pseudoalteromonas spongiae TaxID=298657 RepID=A0ABU8ESU3_9GAMM|nr:MULTISPECIES: phosphatidylglycerophosphatase A [Pseudoalteromonas]ATC99267.1 phosphatidylglycerophosphatase A [Pseudoalteromonas spongiae UST010723-006]MCF6456764.1 phosphatidylglycerophosphatase A [Pseudoalteromonas sp. MMG024]MEC8324813.1 phosphatidylglycerophosphatase A [Pseudomonadota bacterium]
MAQFNLKKFTHFCALGFGLGLAPKAPGTFGTLAAIPFIFLTMMAPLWLQLVVAIAICAIGIWFCDVASRDAGVHDHPAIVWDEVAGFYITMIGAAISWQTLLVGFILFRFFDIVKPWPITLLDKHVKGGFGIMVDDILAGIFSLICLQLVVYYGLI